MKKNVKRLMAFLLTAAITVSMSGLFGVKGYAEEFGVEDWSADQKDGFICFHVTETGNQWGHGVNGTSFLINYADGSSDTFQIGYNLLLKDATYGDIPGGEITAEETSRGGVYMVDISVPNDFFKMEEFSVTYMGKTIDSSEIGEAVVSDDSSETEDAESGNTDAEPGNTDAESGNTDAESVEEIEGSESPKTDDTAKDTDNKEKSKDAVYSGITIDGDFSDWDAVAFTPVEDGSLKSIAMIFDGEDIFIYMEEPEENVWNTSAGAGVTGDGKFVITSDTGKQSVFYVRVTSIIERDGDVVEGSSIVTAGKRIEIRLPASFVKEYKETISLGYFQGNEYLVRDVANLKGGSTNQKQENSGSGIAMGDGYYDWEGYPHSTIAYSSTDAEGSAGIFSDGKHIYIHEITSNSVDKSEYAGNLTPFTICLNGDQKVFENLIYLKLISADASGNTSDNGESDLSGLTAGDYTFYVADNNVAWGFSNWNVNNPEDIHHEIYGKAYVRVTETGYEMECDIDAAKLARVYSEKKGVNLDPTDIKKVEVNFGDIGPNWISWSGTSTGPVAGVAVAVILSFGSVYLIRKRRESFIPEAKTA